MDFVFKFSRMGHDKTRGEVLKIVEANYEIGSVQYLQVAGLVLQQIVSTKSM